MSDETSTPTAPRDYAAQLQSALPQPLLPLLGEWAADELYLHGPRPSLRPDDWLFRTSDLKFLPSRRPCAVLYHKHPPRVPDSLSPAAFLNPSSALNPSSSLNPSSTFNPSSTDADSDTRFARDEGPIHLPHPFRPVLQPPTVLSASASVASASVASLSRAQSMMNPSATHNPDHDQDPVQEDEEPDDLPSAFDNDQDLDAAGESQAEEQKDGKQGARGQQGGKSGSKATGKQKDKASKKAAKQELENRPKMRSLFSRIDYTPQRIIDSRGNPSLSAPPGAQETDTANETLAITNEQAEYVCSLMPRMSLRHIQQSAAQASTFKNEKWSVSGTLLLITLSGLNSVNEVLLKLSKASIPEFMDSLFAYLHDLYNAVDQFGGDIISINDGKMLVCMYPVSQEGEDKALPSSVAGDSALELKLTKSILSALKSAFLIRQTLCDYTSPKGDIKIQAQVGIGITKLNCAMLGSISMWRLLHGADYVLQLETILRTAITDHVITTPESFEVIRNMCHGTETASGYVELLSFKDGFDSHLPLDPVRVSIKTNDWAKIILSTLPPQLQEIYDANAFLSYGQVQPVCIATCYIRDLDPLSDVDLDEQRYESIMEIFGGFNSPNICVNQASSSMEHFFISLSSDIITRSSDNTILELLRICFRLRDALLTKGFSHSFGISTGKSYCGLLGSSIRQEHVTIGTVGLSSEELSKAAPDDGTIYVDRTVYDACRSTFKFEKQPFTIQLIERPTPLYVFKAASKGSNDESSSELNVVGRRHELDTIQRELNTIKSKGTGRPITVLGPLGSGKSIMLKYARIEAEDAGLSIAYANGFEPPMSTNFRAWKQILTQLLGSDIDFARQRLSNLMSGEGGKIYQHLLPLLNEIIPGITSQSTNKFIKKMNEPERMANTVDVLVVLLKKLSETHPIVIAIDDAHGLDDRAWEVLSAVGKRLSTVIPIISGMEPVEKSQLIDFSEMTNSQGSTITLRLMPLNVDEVAELAASILGVQQVPANYADKLLIKTKGYPLALADFLDPLKRTPNRIPRFPDGYDALPELYHPETIVQSRLSTLPSHLVSILYMAAVYKQEFDAKLLVDLGFPEPDAQKVRVYIDELARMKYLKKKSNPLIVASAGANARDFCVLKPIVEKIAYMTMPSTERRKFHTLVAAHYEGKGQSELEKNIPVITMHLKRAFQEAGPDTLDQWILANKATLLCIQHAEDRVLDRLQLEAVYYYLQALFFISFIPASPTRSDLERKTRAKLYRVAKGLEGCLNDAYRVAESSEDLEMLFTLIWYQAYMSSSSALINKYLHMLYHLANQPQFPGHLQPENFLVCIQMNLFLGDYRQCAENCATWAESTCAYSTRDRSAINMGMDPILSLYAIEAIACLVTGNLQQATLRHRQLMTIYQNSSDQSYQDEGLLRPMIILMIYNHFIRKYQDNIALGTGILNMLETLYYPPVEGLDDILSPEDIAYEDEIKDLSFLFLAKTMAAAADCMMMSGLNADMSSQFVRLNEAIENYKKCPFACQLYLPLFSYIVAEVYLAAGELTEAVRYTKEAIHLGTSLGFMFLEPAIRHLQGLVAIKELERAGMLSQDRPSTSSRKVKIGTADGFDDATRNLQDAIDSARLKGAKFFELRAYVDLIMLHQKIREVSMGSPAHILQLSNELDELCRQFVSENDLVEDYQKAISIVKALHSN